MGQNAVEAALYAKLTGSAALLAKLSTATSVYNGQAPAAANPPYVIFQKMAGTRSHVFGARAFDQPVYVVKAVTQGPSAVVAGQIDDLIDALLDDGTLTISGHTLMSCRRESDVSYPENANGIEYRHRGGTYRLYVQ